MLSRVRSADPVSEGIRTNGVCGDDHQGRGEEVMDHTPGPWHWRYDNNGQGSMETTLVGSPDQWKECDYYCFGWDNKSESSRGPHRTPGHEHNHAPTVLSGIGFHGSGDLSIEPDDPDARLIAAAPNMLKALRSLIHWGNQRLPDCVLCGAIGLETPHDPTCPTEMAADALSLAVLGNLAKAEGRE